MLRNSVLVLQENSYASDIVKHCVRPCDLSGRSGVILFRKIHEELLLEALEVELEDITERFSRVHAGYSLHGIIKSRLDELVGEVASMLDDDRDGISQAQRTNWETEIDQQATEEVTPQEEQEEEEEYVGHQIVLEGEGGKDVIIETSMEEEPPSSLTALRGN